MQQESFRTSFLLSHIAKYKIASDDDGWYLEFLTYVCISLRLKHRLHSTFEEKSIIKRDIFRVRKR